MTQHYWTSSHESGEDARLPILLHSAKGLTQTHFRLQWLNLSALPSLRSLDLSGLLNPNGDFAPSELRTLILNNTGIDDDAAPFISSCPHLVTLEVSGTKMTRELARRSHHWSALKLPIEEGLMPIVDACSKLENLDITSCRGVRVADRRRFFEVTLSISTTLKRLTVLDMGAGARRKLSVK